MGGKAYPKATELLILADAGGQQCQSVATVEGRPTAFSRSHGSLAPFLVREVMDQGLFRFSLRLPFLAAVAVISYQFLFLIHGNDRQPLG